MQYKITLGTSFLLPKLYFLLLEIRFVFSLSCKLSIFCLFRNENFRCWCLGEPPRAHRAPRARGASQVFARCAKLMHRAFHRATRARGRFPPRITALLQPFLILCYSTFWGAVELPICVIWPNQGSQCVPRYRIMYRHCWHDIKIIL